MMMGFSQIFCLFLVAWLSKPAAGVLQSSNVALGKTVTKEDGSSAPTIYKATDGIIGTIGTHLYLAADNATHSPAIIIDLEDHYYIEYVTLYNIQEDEQVGLWMIGNTTVEVQIEDGSYVKCGHLDEECPGSRCEEYDYTIPCGLITSRIRIAKYVPSYNNNDKQIFLTEVYAVGFAAESQLDNVAAGMTVSVESGFETSDVSQATDNFIDKLYGNLATLARVEPLAPSSDTEIVIDLGGLRQVEFVSIFTANTVDAAYLIENLEIFVEDYFSNELSCGIVGPACAPDCTDYAYSVSCNLVGTKIKLHQLNQLSVQEVKAFGTSLVGGLDNLALGKTVTALDGVVHAQRPLENAVDGIVAEEGSDPNTNAQITDPNDIKVAFEIDLEVVSQIDHVIFHNINDNEGVLRAMIGKLTVSVGNSSTDAVECGQIWDECIGSGCYLQGYVVPCIGYGSKVIISKTEDAAWLTGRTFILQEVEVYGIPTEDDYCTYGLTADCEFQCHCVNDEACDVDFGYCENGCNDDTSFENMWSGPDCQTGNIGMQYETLYYYGVNYVDPPPNSDPSLVMDRPPTFALDGFVQSNLNNFGMSACIEGQDAVLHIDLGKRYYIDYFTVYNLNTDDAGKLAWIRRIDVRVDDVMCGHIRHENNTANYVLGAKDVTTLSCEMSGQHITLKHKPVSWVFDYLICLEEIVFVGRQLSQAEMADPAYMQSHIPNVAEGKSVIASGVMGTFSASNAVDGYIEADDEEFALLAHVIPASGSGQSQLDIVLGADYNVYGIEVNNINTADLGLRGELEGVQLYFGNSQTPGSVNLCHTFTSDEAVKRTWMGNCDGNAVVVMDLLRLVKDGQPGNSNIRVQEVQIFGYLANGPDGENIAFGKQVNVYQQDYELDVFDAIPVGDRTWEYLTDGFVDRRVDNFDYLGHYRAYDIYGWSNIYLTIDLGDYYDVKSIKIFNINTFSNAALNQLSYIDVTVDGIYCYDTGNTFYGYIHIDCDVPASREVKLFKRSVSASEHPDMERSYDQQIFHVQEIMVFGVGPVEDPWDFWYGLY